MHAPVALFVLALAAAGTALARTFTVTNNCPYTIWPAVFTSAGPVPAHSTGWEAAPGNRVSFRVDQGWNGRIWGRTQCNFGGQGLPTDCVTGGCNGGLECDARTGTGVPPATLGEWNLASDQDWYDVSNVDGVNLPMAITNTAACPAPNCANSHGIISACPKSLRVVNPEGKAVGCKTACSANLDGIPQDSANCCSGSHDKPETCPASGVQYYDIFKKSCPDAYAYAYDESSASALWTCPKDSAAD
ncbi:thaumatin family protein [Rhodotorula paludigena]|uniref:thaumatin family protein n=1 Tax=Rhodotorula paludigena TaxID=86838 RepID=UPI0031748752